MEVTIDAVEHPGWNFVEWVGPVFGENDKTAHITMNTSQDIVGIFQKIKSTSAPTTLAPAATPLPVPTTTPESKSSLPGIDWITSIIDAILPAKDPVIVEPTPIPVPTVTPRPPCGKHDLPMTIWGKTLGKEISVWVGGVKVAEQSGFILNYQVSVPVCDENDRSYKGELFELRLDGVADWRDEIAPSQRLQRNMMIAPPTPTPMPTATPVPDPTATPTLMPGQPTPTPTATPSPPTPTPTLLPGVPTPTPTPTPVPPTPVPPTSTPTPNSAVLSISDNVVIPNQRVTLTGSGFEPGSTVNMNQITLHTCCTETEVLHWEKVNDETSIYVSSNGAFSIPIYLPVTRSTSTQDEQSAQIGVNPSKNGTPEALVDFSFAAHQLSVDPLHQDPCMLVDVSGSGFPQKQAGPPYLGGSNNVTIIISYLSGGGFSNSTTAIPDINGNFSVPIQVPCGSQPGAINNIVASYVLFQPCGLVIRGCVGNSIRTDEQFTISTVQNYP